MIDKTYPSIENAAAGIRGGATVTIGGFGGSGIPELKKKFVHNVSLSIAAKNAAKIHEITADQATTEGTPVLDFTDLFVV